MKGILLALAVLLSSIIDISAQVRVRGYTRKNGTYVAPHYRSAPNHTKADNWSTKGNVNPYTGAAGTRSVTPAVRSGVLAASPLTPQFSAPSPAGSLGQPTRPTPASASASTSRESRGPRSLPKHELGPVLDGRKSVVAYQERSAAKGNAQAQYTMALRYLYGIDVPKDEKKADEYLSAARAGGDIRARDRMLAMKREKRKAEAELREAKEKAAVEMMQTEAVD